jgi:hypothetical protein
MEVIVVKLISKKSIISTGFALALSSFGMGTASATSMELALVLDGSGSISASDWVKQLDGYKSVFASGTFYDTYVAPSMFDSLVVSAYQFAGTVVQEIGWTSIGNNTQASDFGNMFNTTNFVKLNGSTNTEAAIRQAMQSIMDNGITGSKLTIDISTDGNPTACLDPCVNPVSDALAAADTARSNGITINAIGVGNSISTTFLSNLVSPTGFYLIANTYDQFAGTLQTKLGKEIINVPEPSVLFLFGTGLLCVVMGRRRKLTV